MITEKGELPVGIHDLPVRARFGGAQRLEEVRFDVGCFPGLRSYEVRSEFPSAGCAAVACGRSLPGTGSC